MTADPKALAKAGQIYEQHIVPAIFARWHPTSWPRRERGQVSERWTSPAEPASSRASSLSAWPQMGESLVSI